MDYPDQLFKSFRFLGIPFELMARGEMDESAFRTRLTRAVAFADLDAFRQECLQYPLLGTYCEVMLDDATGWLRRFRRLARDLLHRGAEAKHCACGKWVTGPKSPPTCRARWLN